MRSLVVYDSNFGNTQKVAEKIAKGIGAEAVSIKEIEPENLSGYELLVVGSPIIAWKPTIRMMNFLSKLTPGQLAGVKATAFDTRVKLFIHGDAAGKIATSLKSAGAEMVVPTQGFHVKGQEGPLFEGELDKAKDWAELIKMSF